MRLFRRRRSTPTRPRKRDIPRGLWTKCPSCSELIFRRELENSLNVCPKCGHHFQLSREKRIELLTEPGSFREWDADLESADPLKFTGTVSYESKLKASISKTGFREAITGGEAVIGSHRVGFAVMDFSFLGASMGSVVGEKVTRLFERATGRRWPVVIVCASGGARMYEGMLSLMQMAKTSAAIAKHRAAGLAYIPILTHPTTAGVMASFATLGDVIIAEPGALIGFAGPRVIRETTQQELPEGFQRSEFLLKHGLLDMIVPRSEIKPTVIALLDFMRPAGTVPSEGRDA
ncbi:MAG TPA: acetyl-CoA carboxylase carboxyltransferase subunit beta [Kiritimatiellae bacterium]|nr:acetyl-CoA carboxylase carboxyltransferase subunit beta [Kiritimatiellia bacterium]